MRLPCPFCGDRDQSEFVYRGDASLERPGADAGESAFATYVYLRANPAGPLNEYWYHAQGCRQWLVVTRNTRTHEIEAARLASEKAS